MLKTQRLPLLPWPRHRWLVPLFGLTLCLGFLYGPLVVDDPLLGRDDLSFLAPLAKVEGWSEYRAAHSRGQIMDLQPVRDVTFLADFAMKRQWSLSTFHGTNLVLWGMILTTLFALLLALGHSRWWAAWAVAFCGVHPVFVGSVGWVFGGRKHLLATLFIALATLGVTLWQRRQIGFVASLVMAALLFAAAMASQPMALFWPLWLVVVAWVSRRQDQDSLRLWLTLIGTMGVMALAGAYLNYEYYAGIYEQQVGTSKIQAWDGSYLGAMILAQGRYLFNFLCPWLVSPFYGQGSWANLVGLVMIAGVGLGLSRLRPMSVHAPWVALYFLPFLIFFLVPTNIFVSDSYAVVSGLALTVFLAGVLRQCLDNFGGNFTRWALCIGGLVLVGWIALSKQVAVAYSSDHNLWLHAYRTEPTPTSIEALARYEIDRGNHRRAIELALELKAYDEAGKVYPALLAEGVFSDRVLRLPAKLKLLGQYPSDNLWYRYYMGLLHGLAGDWPQALALLEPLVTEQSEMTPGFFEDAVAEAIFVCHRVNGSAEKCSSILRRSRQANPDRPWNQAFFEKQQRQLDQLGLGRRK